MEAYFSNDSETGRKYPGLCLRYQDKDNFTGFLRQHGYVRIGNVSTVNGRSFVDGYDTTDSIDPIQLVEASCEGNT